jgi:deoxyribodipyrimidine photolyase-like uncharacterized protein
MEANFNSVESEPPKLVNSNIGSLLFADDLLVISESKEGLQNSINKLSDFCDNWQLTVNVKKKQKLWPYNNVTLIAIHHSLTWKYHPKCIRI